MVRSHDFTSEEVEYIPAFVSSRNKEAKALLSQIVEHIGKRAAIVNRFRGSGRMLSPLRPVVIHTGTRESSADLLTSIADQTTGASPRIQAHGRAFGKYSGMGISVDTFIAQKRKETAKEDCVR